jgi:hypothetical protein
MACSFPYCCLGGAADGLRSCGEAWIRKPCIRSERFSLYTVAFAACDILSPWFLLGRLLASRFSYSFAVSRVETVTLYLVCRQFKRFQVPLPSCGCLNFLLLSTRGLAELE